MSPDPTASVEPGAPTVGSLTGNYSVAGSGSGTINLQLDTGVSVTVAAATNTGGAGMQMLFTGGMTGLYGIALRQ